MSAKRILITGGSGFLGESIASYVLDEDRAASVTVLDPKLPSALLARFPDRVRHDARTLDEFVEGNAGERFSEVVHLAWSSIPATSMRAPVSDLLANVAPGVRFIEHCAALGVGRFVFASSGGTVYGDVPVGLAEEDYPTHPISIYGASKLALETYARVIGLQNGLKVLSLRVANPYGGYQFRGTPIGSIASFMMAAKKRQPIVIFGDGAVVRDYIAIEDVAAAFSVALNHDLPSGAYNIGTGAGASLNEIVTMIEALSGASLSVERRPGRAFDVSRIVLDCDRYTRCTSWRPRITLADGMAGMWKSLEDAGAATPSMGMMS